MDLLQKLRIKSDQPLWLINAPAGMQDLLPGMTIKSKAGKEKPVGQMLLFVTGTHDLHQSLPALADYIAPTTLLWICYPKKSGAIGSDLAHMKDWDLVFQLGYRGQTSASINSDWSALRVTSAPPAKPSTYDLPPEERKVEGIDFVARTVSLPADALAAVNHFAGMAAFFDTLSFTVKKEYVVAITEAKQEATRQKRIQKMTGQLQEKMHTKQLKKSGR